MVEWRFPPSRLNYVFVNKVTMGDIIKFARERPMFSFSEDTVDLLCQLTYRYHPGCAENLTLAVKLQEEAGELANEVLASLGRCGSKAGPDGIQGEAVDVMICALALYRKANGSWNQLDQMIKAKLEKWKAKGGEQGEPIICGSGI